MNDGAVSRMERVVPIAGKPRSYSSQ